MLNLLQAPSPLGSLSSGYDCDDSLSDKSSTSQKEDQAEGDKIDVICDKHL